MSPEELERLEILEVRMNEHGHQNLDNSKVLPCTSFVTVSLPAAQSQTATNYGLVFIATKPCFVKAISYVHTVAGSSTPTTQVERLRGSTAIGAGTDLLKTAFTGSTTANIVQRGILINQPGLKLGDRLAIKSAGTLTNLQGVAITIELQY